MKTNQELLDFYGVKLNKIYKYKGEKTYFKIGTNRLNELGVVYINADRTDSDCIDGPISLLNNLDYEEYKRPILNKKEKEYLSTVIKPFKDRIIEICKIKTIEKNKGYNYIAIKVKSLMEASIEENIYLPLFKTDTMYKDMEEDKPYTIKELGL